MPLASHLWARGPEVWHLVLAGFALLFSVVASAHVILYKRDARSAIGWVGFVWLLPLVGALLYFVLGVNRIRRQATSLRGDLERYRAQAAEAACLPEELRPIGIQSDSKEANPGFRHSSIEFKNQTPEPTARLRQRGCAQSHVPRPRRLHGSRFASCADRRSLSRETLAQPG